MGYERPAYTGSVNRVLTAGGRRAATQPLPLHDCDPVDLGIAEQRTIASMWIGLG